jgi:ribosome maturation protein SDO1
MNSEVLQIDKIFTSASHGDIASNKDLRHYFGDVSNQEIIKIILEKGELQLGEKERDVSIHQIYLGIVKFI